MSINQLATKVQAIIDRLRCPYGDPGLNPDYLDEDEVATLEEVVCGLNLVWEAAKELFPSQKEVTSGH